MFRTLKTLRTEGESEVRTEGWKRPQILGLEEGLRKEGRRRKRKDLPETQPRSSLNDLN